MYKVVGVLASSKDSGTSLNLLVRVNLSSDTGGYTDVEMFPRDFQEKSENDPTNYLTRYPTEQIDTLWITVQGLKYQDPSGKPPFSRAYKIFHMDKWAGVCIW